MQTLSFWRLLYPREAFLKKLLGFHYKNKLYLEVLPGAKLSNMYCLTTKQRHLANADGNQQQNLERPCSAEHATSGIRACGHLCSERTPICTSRSPETGFL